MRISTLAGAVAAAAVLLLPLATAASAQDRDCADFGSQAEAQAALDGAVGDPERLDADGDGTACESHFGGSSGPGGGATRTTAPTTSRAEEPGEDESTKVTEERDPDDGEAGTGTSTDGDGNSDGDGDGDGDGGSTGVVPVATLPGRDRDCADFASQAAAQAALDRTTGDPERLDADDDGIACENHFGEPATGTTTGSDTDSRTSTDTAESTDSPDTGTNDATTSVDGQVRVLPVGGVDTGDGSAPRT